MSSSVLDRKISTRRAEQRAPNFLKVYEKILGTLLQASPDSSYADLAADGKQFLATHRIAHAPETFNQALRMVMAAYERVHPYRPPVATIPQRPPDPPPISHAEACDILRRIGAGALVRSHTIRPMRLVADVDEDAFEAARERAAEMGIDLTRDAYLR